MFLIPFLSLTKFVYINGFLGALALQFYWLFKKFISPNLQRRVPHRSAAPPNTKSSEFIKDIISKHESLPKESAEWLNVFLCKFYADFYNTKAFNYYFYTQYVRSLFNFRRTIAGYFIVSIFCIYNFVDRNKQIWFLFLLEIRCLGLRIYALRIILLIIRV